MRIDWCSLTDAELLAQCDWDRYRASGPGGQKRNKTDSAVRLRHPQSGLIVTATESHSQHENRARAVRRLRAALALQIRQPITIEQFSATIQTAIAGGRLALKPRDPRYLPTAAALLDYLEQHEGRLSTVAAAAGLSTAQLVDFFRDLPDAWQALSHLRATHNQKPLR